MSLIWSSYVASKSPKRGSKRKTADFDIKSHFAWIKSATKFLCVKINCQRQSCKAFIGLSLRKWLVGGDPFYLKFWVKLTALERNRRFSICFAQRLGRNIYHSPLPRLHPSGEGNTPPHTLPPRRLRRLDVDALGVEVSAPCRPTQFCTPSGAYERQQICLQRSPKRCLLWARHHRDSPAASSRLSDLQQ